MSVEEISLASYASTSKIAIVGVGGAGNNLIDHGIARGIDPEDCVAVNNDTSQLSRCVASNKIFIGNGGSETSEIEQNNAARLFQSSAHRILPFTQDSKFTIIVTGLGGNTGTVAAPIVAQYNRTLVKPVISLVAIPFIHERERRFVAIRALKKMVESCDSTIIIDNSMESEMTHSADRISDAIASVTLQTLAQLVRSVDRQLSQKFLELLSLGSITTVASAPWTHKDTVQSVVYTALRSPSAPLPISNTKGAVLVYSGPGTLSTSQVSKAYQTLVSLIGHDVKFMSTTQSMQIEPRVSIFLTGYNYEMTIRSFVDFIQDLYDLEYGGEISTMSSNVPIPLFDMEREI